MLDPTSLAERISAETGLPFAGSQGRDADGSRWVELRPADHPSAQTFSIRTVIGWRRLDISFRPGNFAAELVGEMGAAGEAGKKVFRSVLAACSEDGAEVVVSANGSTVNPDDESIWRAPWRSFSVTIRRGMLAINVNDGDRDADRDLVETWTGRAAAAILALLPVEVDGGDQDAQMPDVVGLPEGARCRVEVNRYERDRRNRAAALAIHGYQCKACDLDMSHKYGSDAVGLIEVHHVTPVSMVGPNYIVDPKSDLVPLCPNCHAVVHRRSPPFTVGEVRKMLGAA